MATKDPKIKIFVAHHKPGYIYKDEIFVPIQVGKQNAEIDLGILGDNTGDNISEKNYDYYAELTAQYRVWKNYDLTDVDYVGFCHYRRYMIYGYGGVPIGSLFKFNKGDSIVKILIRILVNIRGLTINTVFNVNLIKSCSNSIKNKIRDMHISCYCSKRMFSLFHPIRHMGIKDLELRNLLKQVVLDTYPQYEIFLDKVGNNMFYSGYNTYIMSKDLFYDYSNWIFTILFKYENILRERGLESRFKKEPMCTGGHRILGYVSERLFNLFVEYQKSKGKIFNYDAKVLFFD